MAHRSIGQERFDFAGRTRSASSLDELGKLINWAPVAALLDPLYSATKGEPASPPLAMFKALLLSIWYDLSDVKLAEGNCSPGWKKGLRVGRVDDSPYPWHHPRFMS